MCLEIHLSTEIGPTGALDLAERRMCLGAVLSREDRVVLARGLLSAAGVEQPLDPEVARCVCGGPLDPPLPQLTVAT